MKPSVLSLFLIFAIGTTRAADNTIPSSESDILQITKIGTYNLLVDLKGGQKIEVTIKIIPCRVRFPHDPHVHLKWPGEGESKTVIGKMTIKINGTPTTLDLSDYDYLGDPDTLTALKDGDNYIIQLAASDAAGAYSAKWSFSYSKKVKEYLLRKRVIQAGEFPEVHDSTDYTYMENSN